MVSLQMKKQVLSYFSKCVAGLIPTAWNKGTEGERTFTWFLAADAVELKPSIPVKINPIWVSGVRLRIIFYISNLCLF